MVFFSQTGVARNPHRHMEGDREDPGVTTELSPYSVLLESVL